MKAGFYPKIAMTGIRKNKRMYTPYILTCTGMVMMHYIITFLAMTKLLKHMKGGDTLGPMLGLGSWVIGIFSVIFLFYTNSFLIRRRKKEFGLYNILGMGKRNIGRILVWETVIIGAVSLAAGLSLGIVFSKFAELGLVNILRTDVSYSFKISGGAVCQTALLFCGIFILILLNSLRQIHTANPITLLRSENTGEKAPRANWFLGLLGALLLAGAYYLAVTIEDPISALLWFFVAVIMVIVGTYLLFIAGSVLFCRILQKNKKYYYKANHFVSVSSMAYRMKRNGAGLASICILGTMVLVMLTGSACLYFGAEDSLKTRYPRDITAEVNMKDMSYLSDDNIGFLRETVIGKMPDGEKGSDIIDYRLASITGLVKDGIAETDERNISVSDSLTYENVRQLFFIPVDDYNRMTGENNTVAKGEAMISTLRCEYPWDNLEINNGMSFRITKKLDTFTMNPSMTMGVIPSIVVIVPDMQSVSPIAELKDSSGDKALRIKWFYGFDTDLPAEKQISVCNDIAASLRDIQLTENGGGIESDYCESLEQNRADFYATYGGLFFLGIMLSIVFIFAAVLIIYYKQISEGYEDQSRFGIMMKVGMTAKNIRRSINSQMLTVFFMPLAAAVMHLAFAFPMIRRLLMLFNLTNLTLLLITAGISVLIFAVFYTLVYRMTSNAYYSIVSGRTEK